ncbi:DUF2541 family protein [Vibrio sagamiensis]|uniref:DUF2541 domain-containing protein n=1 Tax=Vibrio sagamiensis NBRC 104589 TaxID=1219064 RepID=A0A511QD99_9VIBR|nr:DUF2541 family protein [Vibrio sagamiensis]PNQ53792.1 DUF2541 domain-containing protein [Vibrio agarivorans]GEM75285.1 hypothetical protein VSA01S_13970 [Vibrio sagamiensis NBRC 104589]
MKLITTLLTAALTASTLIVPVHADDKFTLGRTILLEHGNLAAKIPMIVCRNTNAIKIKAEKNLELRKAVVKFQNGEEQTIHFHRNLRKDNTTDWRYFGYRRCVKNIDVYGNSKGSKAGVRVYGKEKNG